MDDLIFEANKGARSNAKKIVIVFSEDQLNPDQQIYWDNLSEELGVKISFIVGKNKISTPPGGVRAMSPVMSVENVNTLHEIGILLNTGKA